MGKGARGGRVRVEVRVSRGEDTQQESGCGRTRCSKGWGSGVGEAVEGASNGEIGFDRA